MPGNPRKRKKRHLSSLAKRTKDNGLNLKMSKGRRDTNSDSQTMSNSQDEGEESTESPQEHTSLEDGNSYCSSALPRDISFLPHTEDILISHTIDNSQDENKGSTKSKQELLSIDEANSHCNNPSHKDSYVSLLIENKMLPQTFQSISSTSQDKSEGSIESSQELLSLEANSHCNTSHNNSFFLTNTKDIASQTFCPDYINLNFNMVEENVNSVGLELNKTKILQNLEEKFSSLQLSPKQINRKFSSCSDLNPEKDHKLEPEENVITNISKQEINIEKWEEGQEVEVKVIEPSSIYLSEPSISDKMTDVGNYSYWSSVGLLTNKRKDPLYLGPDKEDLKNVFKSAYNEEVIRLTSPTYNIDLQDLPRENIAVECATKNVKKTLESENNEQVIKLTSPIFIESDDENPSLECETNTVDYIQYDLMDEISIGGENNIESLNNDEPIEQLQLKEEKKSFFARLIGGIFGCFFFHKKQKLR